MNKFDPKTRIFVSQKIKIKHVYYKNNDFFMKNKTHFKYKIYIYIKKIVYISYRTHLKNYTYISQGGYRWLGTYIRLDPVKKQNNIELNKTPALKRNALAQLKTCAFCHIICF